MAWRADQIYIPATPAVLDYFQQHDGFHNHLFLVQNWLSGVRAEYAIESFTKNPKYKHQFPPEGVLVIRPVVYGTGYDKDQDSNPFWKNYREGGRDKWDFLPDAQPSFALPKSFDRLRTGALRLLALLEQLHHQLQTPICYYNSEMWGGDIEHEYVIAFDQQPHFYMYDTKQRHDAKFDANGQPNYTKAPVLKAGLAHINLHINNAFFALHEGSFHWSKFYLSPTH